MKRFNCKNIHQVPKILKIVINVGINEAKRDAKVLESIQTGVGMITGQKPAIRKAKKAVAGFKLRKGLACGLVVTLRRGIMYEFLDRLINVTMPRIRDFQGVSDKSFDEAGNYSFGLSEQTMFPEIDIDKVQATHGMDITIVTNAGSRERALELLKLFNFPFRRK